MSAICSGSGEGVPEKEKVELKKRKLVQEITEKIYILERGTQFTTSITKVRFLIIIIVENLKPFVDC